MILDDKKLAFIHIPRTGGSSIEVALAGQDWWLIDPDTKHLSVGMTRNLMGEEKWGTYFKFSIVRNPWDRVISMFATGWWEKETDSESSHSLRNFIARLSPHPHEKHGSLHYHEILDGAIDYIARFETLNQDFDYICHRLGATDMILPHCERTTREHYSNYYDEETAALVANVFKKDIELYRYSFERQFDYHPHAAEALQIRTRR